MASEDPATSTQADEQQLRVLVILHYGLGGLMAATFPLWVYIAMLGKPLLYPPAGEVRHTDDATLFTGAFLLMLGVMMAVLSLMHGALLAYVGRCIAKRKRRRLIVGVSIFNLTFAPLGTIVSLFALVVVLRPTVKALFD